MNTKVKYLIITVLMIASCHTPSRIMDERAQQYLNEGLQAFKQKYGDVNDFTKAELGMFIKQENADMKDLIEQKSEINAREDTDPENPDEELFLSYQLTKQIEKSRRMIFAMHLLQRV